MKYLILFISILFYTSIANAQATTTGTNDDYYATNADDVIDGSLVLHWVGRHQGMNYAQDVSSYKVQGTITGASRGTGTGRGLYFDGVNDYVSFGSQTQYNFGTQSFSFMARYTPANLKGTDQMVLDMSGGRLMIAIDGNNKTYISVHSGAYQRWVNSTNNLATNTSVFVAGVVDQANYPSGNIKLYINGYQDGATNTIGTSTITVTSPLGIGWRSGGTPFYFNGNIDFCRIYNRALSSGEVNRIYVSNPH